MVCAHGPVALFLGLALGFAAAGLPEDSGCAQRPPSNVVTFVCSSDVDVQVVGSTQDALRTLPDEVFMACHRRARPGRDAVRRSRCLAA